MNVRLAVLLAFLSAGCIAAALLPDVVNALVRLGMATGILGLATVLLLLARRWRAARVVLVGVVIVVVAVAGTPLPTGTDTQNELRASFVEALRRYEGVTYVWGGEGTKGIDCSGLMRRAWRDALVQRGVRGEFAFLRRALTSWWQDRTARDLRDGPETAKVMRIPSVRALPREQRKQGDLLVTTDGTHIMAFVDDGAVIEADPMTMKVMILDDRRDTQKDTPWLDIPLFVVRWPELG
jgi:hypothetical protein